jgi:hypothetical protein
VSINIPVFFILDFSYKLLCLLDGLLYTGNYSFGFFLAEALGVRDRGRNIPIEKNTGRITVNYFESRYTDTTIFERKLGVIYYRQKLCPVILIIIYERAEALIYILVYNFGLAVGLRVVSGGQLQLNT